MTRLVLVARLRPEALPAARRLLESGPPFDPERVGITRHFAFLSAGEVVFWFEGPEVEWTLDDLVRHPVVAAALEPWKPLAAGPPRVADELYAWEREQASPARPRAARAGRGRARSAPARRGSPGAASA